MHAVKIAARLLSRLSGAALLLAVVFGSS
ncbi:MAG: hypothetical protein H6Q02_469, partial [Acidobacteria bacterium]|nr:hypothetical protein [Acidobacteriota bacterium]